ncbi:ABC transporter permease, partial [Mycobacteroides abscessus]|nr:ABC transporter permease [Mycobacteroides abscessus]
MTASTITATGAAQSAPATARRRALAARQLLQPLACIVAVTVSLAYVNLADVSASEKRSLGMSNL